MGRSLDWHYFYGYCWVKNEALEYLVDDPALKHELVEAYLADELPVSVGRWGTDSSPSDFIYIAESMQQGWWQAKPINPADLSALTRLESDAWDKRFNDFFEHYPIERPQERAQWWIAPWWG